MLAGWGPVKGCEHQDVTQGQHVDTPMKRVNPQETQRVGGRAMLSRSTARKTLGAIRFVNGAAGLFAPELLLNLSLIHI